jgi:hypothetical protein
MKRVKHTEIEDGYNVTSEYYTDNEGTYKRVTFENKEGSKQVYSGTLLHLDEYYDPSTDYVTAPIEKYEDDKDKDQYMLGINMMSEDLNGDRKDLDEHEVWIPVNKHEPVVKEVNKKGVVTNENWNTLQIRDYLEYLSEGDMDIIMNHREEGPAHTERDGNGMLLLENWSQHNSLHRPVKDGPCAKEYTDKGQLDRIAWSQDKYRSTHKYMELLLDDKGMINKITLDSGIKFGQAFNLAANQPEIKNPGAIILKYAC